ncbi:MAG: transcriptional repressor [Oscillospiraceae bacterium]|nr:transcriptional repressor [Oscillospiraceae bacterium]
MVRKYSKKREAVLAALQARRDNPTVEMLYQELKPRFPELSLGTVYRNLAILVEEKQAVNIGSFRGQERYDGRLDPHSHFVCRSCGRIEDLDVPDTVSTIFHQIESASGAQPESYALTITGVCAACRGKEKLARASAREAINGSNVKWNTNEEDTVMKKWVCQVCGHVHEGAAPPQLCPVCKVTSSHYAEAGQPPVEDMFSKDLETEQLAKIIEGEESAEPVAVKKWVCQVCGHVHEGAAPP